MVARTNTKCPKTPLPPLVTKIVRTKLPWTPLPPIRYSYVAICCETPSPG